MTKRTSPRANEKRQPRIIDVARLAGVSTATVSRTIASPHQVRTKLRDRVETAIHTLGYTPHAAARSLRAGQTKMILVMTRQRWSAPFFSEILHGIDAELSAQGYSMILANLDDGPKERHAIDMMFSGRFDGAINLSGETPAADGRSMQDTGLPLVSICTPSQTIGSVLTNEAECIVQGARHLIDFGHRQFLYISGPRDNVNETGRWQALESFFSGTDARGLSLQRVEGDFTFGGGVEAAKAFLVMRKRPTGIIACSDELAIGFMKKVQAVGLKVPRDVSVIGFDGIEFADFCEPTLTTIRQPRFDMGQAGARILLEAIETSDWGDKKSIILSSQLDIRDSTGPAPE